MSARDALAELLASRRTVVVTGAGLSTDSGIPDYRGDGSRPRSTPMTIERFLGDEASRQRYWAGSALGWRRMAAAAPNDGHRALAALERAGRVSGIATQNVDGLHGKAGSQRVTELHGHLRTVSCLACGRVETRDHLDARLRAANPWLPRSLHEAPMRPDGDAEIERVAELKVPVCEVCGGMLKPDVVFFGELVRPADRAAAEALVDASEALLVAGSSLVVNTAVRLVHRAERAGLPVAILNRTPTPLDDRADVVVRAGATETLTALAGRLA